MGFNQAPALPYRNLGIVEDGDTASQAIEKDKYVIWKGGNYFAKTDILQGETFVVGTNLTEIPDGALNGIIDALNSNLTNKAITLTSASQSNYTLSNMRARRNGNMIMISTTVNVVSPATSYGGVAVFTGLPTPSMPLSQIFPSWENDSSTTNSLRVYVNGDGTIGFRHGIANHTYDVYLIYPLA